MPENTSALRLARCWGRDERLAMKAAIKHDLTACTVDRQDELTGELAERRFQTRQGSKDASN